MIKLQAIAEAFDLKIIGDKNKNVRKVVSFENQEEETLTWAKAPKYANKVQKGILLLNEELDFETNPNVTYLLTRENPKLVLAKLIIQFFPPSIEYYLVDEVDKHRKNKKISISKDVFIGQNVTIGDGTVIMPQVVIEADTVIGRNCIIKSHVSIASEGLGLQLNPQTDLLEKLPQIGNVIIEDHVDIGPTTTVRRGTLGSTLIKEGAKIGSLINIGHNCVIGRNAILTCNMVISGSSVIGDYVYIGVNAVIRNGIEIGEKTQIGMGAVVTKSLPASVIAYGNPAKIIRANES